MYDPILMLVSTILRALNVVFKDRKKKKKKKKALIRQQDCLIGLIGFSLFVFEKVLGVPITEFI